jgi:hypothetical protein
VPPVGERADRERWWDVRIRNGAVYQALFVQGRGALGRLSVAGLVAYTDPTSTLGWYHWRPATN